MTLPVVQPWPQPEGCSVSTCGIVEHMQEPVLLTDEAGALRWANRAYLALVGGALSSGRGEPPPLFNSDGEEPVQVPVLWNCRHDPARRFRVACADGSLRHVTLSILPLPRDDLEGPTFLCTLRDVSLELETERRICELAGQAIRARDATVMGMAGLAEERQGAPGAHLDRIEAYTTAMVRWVVEHHAERLPEGQRDPEEIGRAARVHDLGKLGLPDGVLLKKGALDAAEQAAVREHPAHAARILDQVLADQPESAFLRLARDVAACHHEAWDGSGYPEALVGDEIPVAAQIVAVADALDAITSARSYKPAHPFEDAIEWIAERAGAQFSPLSVHALISAREELEAIHREQGDPPSEGPIRPAGISRPAVERATRRTVFATILEAMGSRIGGEVVVRSGETVGRVFIHAGRVAWAHVGGDAGRLSTRLVEDGVSADEVRGVFDECRRSGANFAEELVRWGLVSRERMRLVLKDHVSEQLGRVLTLEEPEALFVPQSRSYATDLTFTLDELLERSGG